MNTWPHLLVEAKTTSGLRLKPLLDNGLGAYNRDPPTG